MDRRQEEREVLTRVVGAESLSEMDASTKTIEQLTAEINRLHSEVRRLNELRRLHAGDTLSLSNELEEWRTRALEAEARLAMREGGAA